VRSSLPPPAAVLSYCHRLADRLAAVSDGSLRAAYLHGSAGLGGWGPGRSDVDLLVVAAAEISGSAAGELARTLAGRAGECPGRDLEASVVTVTQAACPAPPWPFVVHVTAGPGRPGKVVTRGAELPGDPDLPMHYAVCRAAGWPVAGPAPAELIGPVGRSLILGYLARELAWGLEHGSLAYAVLNACRAEIFLTHGDIVSKVAGGEAALARREGPAGLIAGALRQQHGAEPDQPPSPDAAAFVLPIAGRLRTAASAPAGQQDGALDS
jgi:streptomycin 3"-adenylyltransferase